MNFVFLGGAETECRHYWLARKEILTAGINDEKAGDACGFKVEFGLEDFLRTPLECDFGSRRFLDVTLYVRATLGLSSQERAYEGMACL